MGRIVGNLSLIPFVRRGHVVYLIANVAVHPDYRRRGIARQLTQTALDYLRQRGVSSAWLQVRDDNPVGLSPLPLAGLCRARLAAPPGRAAPAARPH